MTAVHIDMNARGSWEVAIPGRRDAVLCKNLDEARRVARRWAQRQRPCELIVRDAYHRVLQHQLVDGENARP